MRIFLGLPTAGSPTTPYLESLATLRLPETCFDFERCVVTGNFIPGQREVLAREAIDRDYDILAMIDDDMIPPPDALLKLCAALDADPQTAVAGALYYSRDGLRPMAVSGWDSRDTTAAVIPAFGPDSTDTVDGVGFGCVAIRVAALAKLERPIFSAHIVIEHTLRRVRIADEDYVLCERLRQAGNRVRLHAGVRCGHYDRASRTVFPRHWEDATVTNRPRMYVRTPEGEALVDAQPDLPRAREEHRPVTLYYIDLD